MAVNLNHAMTLCVEWFRGEVVVMPFLPETRWENA